MLIAAITEMMIGVDAERKSLEEVAIPMSAVPSEDIQDLNT
jgi:hypothetical protein